MGPSPGLGPCLPSAIEDLSVCEISFSSSTQHSQGQPMRDCSSHLTECSSEPSAQSMYGFTVSDGFSGPASPLMYVMGHNQLKRLPRTPPPPQSQLVLKEPIVSRSRKKLGTASHPASYNRRGFNKLRRLSPLPAGCILPTLSSHTVPMPFFSGVLL